MSSDALFGPDGTQPPPPPRSFPDPLLGLPGGPEPGPSPRGEVPLPVAPPAPAPAADRRQQQTVRRAIEAALNEAPPFRPPARRGQYQRSAPRTPTPPAIPTTGERPRKSGVGSWLFLLLILAVILYNLVQGWLQGVSDIFR
ncbi:hypothetical protein GCM10012275_15040 [Longimycelium tulufanense]|uniref:Uncharacterized protein n=1 Tax=Longimycelium tulufanense TaxID=907463 RepID=A0A8J3C6Z5_9PSEU|nr:hypothetical protein [Longimycelium tulufanense]GGM44990.1 hypothetical protein GCM10012275_15040 [Longimycelium tulufanense]